LSGAYNPGSPGAAQKPLNELKESQQQSKMLEHGVPAQVETDAQAAHVQNTQVQIRHRNTTEMHAGVDRSKMKDMTDDNFRPLLRLRSVAKSQINWLILCDARIIVNTLLECSCP
jgi:hypothetical protein